MFSSIISNNKYNAFGLQAESRLVKNVEFYKASVACCSVLSFCLFGVLQNTLLYTLNTFFHLFQAFLNSWVLVLCFGVLASALVPQCLQQCEQCRDKVPDYDTESCVNGCFKGQTDPQCTLSSTHSAKRSFTKRALECKKYCYYCKVTYPDYNGNECLEACEISGGYKVDINCINYWWMFNSFLRQKHLLQ